MITAIESCISLMLLLVFVAVLPWGEDDKTLLEKLLRRIFGA